MTTNERPERSEDGLKHLLDCEEGGSHASVDSLAGALKLRRARAARLLTELGNEELARPKGDHWQLTGKGRKAAVEVVRKHRLLETWLARETGVPPENWHRAAHVAEHRLGAIETDELADRLGNPRFDPHGDPIPTREGELPAAARISLAEWPLEQDAVIVHLEDEPEAIYGEMVQAGLHPGMVLHGLERQPGGVILCTAEGRGLQLSASWLTRIHVDEVTEEHRISDSVRRLSDLGVGSVSQVHGLSPACAGAERRRLLDLGLVPGTEIRCEFTSPFGSPRSYLIRGTMIGLRREQADRVLVIPEGGAA
ncbi:metal-dependent transcriptional regulator [Haloferula sargassicola]|uniref:Ferrous iron transporter FeoA-like domain-containing protein n=1 Tax=Haloferula sargassicola TaxID=490096 RepID=A0ABP9UQB1_9BACT